MTFLEIKLAEAFHVTREASSPLSLLIFFFFFKEDSEKGGFFFFYFMSRGFMSGTLVNSSFKPSQQRLLAESETS